ncbi:peptidylprolyl isomerase [Sphingobium sp.]|uniref:peptidylprolyl isomerase n=1 Tax=Sphingobium sp. TaxID=1912891 RepID=UPI0028BD8E57|nr:peptidylprolyl isomerase [Sphingobium sp.]
MGRPGARRSLLLCGAGAIVGLIIAGFGLFTADGTRTSIVPAEDVALVNQVPILMSDYAAQLRALYDVSLSQATMRQKRQVLDDMIREELYVQRGVELGMQADTIEVRQALVGAVEAQAAADATMAVPDESALHAYYEKNRARYADEGQMALDDYVQPVSAAGRAAAAAADLRLSGTAPAVLARHGLRRSAIMTDGEEFIFAARLHLGERLFAVASRMKDGEVSEPVPLPDGIHILVMRHHIAPPPRPFAVVRDRVLQDFVTDQAKTLTAGNERFLRKRADISLQKGYE